MSNDTTWGDLGGATFLTQDDIDDPIVVTIARFTREAIGMDDNAQQKTVVHWQEDVKPLITGKTVLGQIRAVTGAGKPKEAIGQPVELYRDRTVTFKGKVVGGIRVRAAR